MSSWTSFNVSLLLTYKQVENKPVILKAGFVDDCFATNVFMDFFHVILQSVAIFFSQVMASIGGNTAGPGT
jgi:hypothetical protein